MRTLEQIIAEHPFWHRLKSDYFPRINQCASELHFGVQQQIFLEGSDADRFYLIHADELRWRHSRPARASSRFRRLEAAKRWAGHGCSRRIDGISPHDPSIEPR